MSIFRRLLITFAALAFGLTLVGVSIARDQANSIRTKTSTTFNYDPGYFLELVHDRLTDWLTFDGNQKIPLWLEFAQHRFQIAQGLITNHQEAQALLMARKAIGYQTQVVALLEKPKGTKITNFSEDVKSTTEAMKQSHKVLTDWQEKGLVSNSSEYDSLIKLINSGLERLTNLRP